MFSVLRVANYCPYLLGELVSVSGRVLLRLARVIPQLCKYLFEVSLVFIVQCSQGVVFRAFSFGRQYLI